MKRTAGFVLAVLLAGIGHARAADPASEPLRRAVAYLAREVPAWPAENRCFSCHNNGDAARALLAARKDPGADATLADTLGWLEQPARWDTGAVDPAISDKVLARLQFTLALTSAVERGAIRDRTALARAADLVANDQATDGSWPIGSDGTLGGPTTYGRPLATALAAEALSIAGATRFDERIGRARGWLRARPVENVLDASAVLIGLPAEAPADRESRRHGFELLRQAQTERGGWGPFVRSPPEPFDTAIALVALARWPERAETDAMIRRGRNYLSSIQNDDGSWTETTRPAGGESYAQRISTTGWAVLALVATR